jgi:hypothetical protein
VRNNTEDYWRRHIATDMNKKPSLKYLNADNYSPGEPHPVWSSCHGNAKYVKKAVIRAKLLTGTYTLQGNLARFNQNRVDPTCKLCKQHPEDRAHFLASCSFTQDLRKDAVTSLLEITANTDTHDDIEEATKTEGRYAALLLNPQSITQLPMEIRDRMERIATSVCYSMHTRRWNALLNLN